MKARISNLEVALKGEEISRIFKKEAVNYQKIIEEIEKNGIVKTTSTATRQNGPDVNFFMCENIPVFGKALVLALKKTIKDLKAQIKQQLEEISFMKKNVKQTRVQELEVFLFKFSKIMENRSRGSVSVKKILDLRIF